MFDNGPYRGGDELPEITFGMLIDFLGAFQIRHRPETFPGEIRGFVSVSADCAADRFAGGDQTLYVAHITDALQVLADHPRSLVLVLVEGEGPLPEWVESHRNRVVAIKKPAKFSYFLLLLQEYLMKVLLWRTALEHVGAGERAFQDVIDVSERMIGAFVAVSDSGYNVVACSQCIEPQDPLMRRLLEEGCYPPTVADRVGDGACAEEPFVEEEASGRFAYLHYPLCHHGAYGGHVVMACERPVTQGRRDLFLILARKVHSVFRSQWEARVRAEAPLSSFAIKLIEGEAMTPAYLEAQTRLAAMPDPAQLKLFLVRPREKSVADRSFATSLVRSIGALNDGCCWSLMYENGFLGLFYAPADDDSLFSNKRVLEEFQGVFERFDVVVGTSQIFENIVDLRLAYQQAVMTLDFRRSIDLESLADPDGQPRRMYTFEEAFLYYLISRTEIDEGFLSFSFSHTLLEKILADDRRQGTNDLYLLWAYIKYNCNAFAAATHLFMHRNTVNHHIRKIEKRFDIDLSDTSIRDRLLIDFKIFFLGATWQEDRDDVRAMFARREKPM